ncbi:hypothetical protein BJX76DRAFT_321805 [Aspergillus varians]
MASPISLHRAVSLYQDDLQGCSNYSTVPKTSSSLFWFKYAFIPDLLDPGGLCLRGTLALTVAQVQYSEPCCCCIDNISNTLVVIAASFAIAVQEGGVLSSIYGTMVVAVAMLCTGASAPPLAANIPSPPC